MALALAGTAVNGQSTKLDILRIGTSGTITPSGNDRKKEEAALATLKSFIKEETGLNNDILREMGWNELADRMAKGQLHIGVFQGQEFAWAQEKYPDLKPLAIAINVYRYPVVYVVVKKNNPVKDFAGLKGQSLSLPNIGEDCLHLFVERQCQMQGKAPNTYFSKVLTPDNVEDALDDVVDGAVQAAVVDRVALEAFKNRKPGRFNQLKPVAESQPFPPPVVAFYDKKLDAPTLKRLEDGLLNAHRKEKGETMLTLFRLTGFETAPSDFGKVLADTRKAYPPPNAKAK
jgi:ABC-type phosphate/phosphonate transport system substrate-binding protein